jgi:hypothetical protein
VLARHRADVSAHAEISATSIPHGHTGRCNGDAHVDAEGRGQIADYFARTGRLGLAFCASAHEARNCGWNCSGMAQGDSGWTAFGDGRTLSGMRLLRLGAPASGTSRLEGIGGWLLVYLIALGLFALHDLGLTVAAVITHAASLPALLVYAISNMVLVTYTLVLYVLMMGKRKSAVANNVIFNVLSILFLLWWHVLGMKSAVGTLVDAVPGIVCTWYVLASTRVRNTFVRT